MNQWARRIGKQVKLVSMRQQRVNNYFISYLEGRPPFLNNSGPNMVGLYSFTKSTFAFSGICFSIPTAQKQAFTNNLLRSSLKKSIAAPMVVANAFPSFPPGI